MIELVTAFAEHMRNASHEQLAKVATDATYGGGAMIAGSLVPHYVFGLPVDLWQVLGIIVGIVTALGGLITNFYFKLRHDRRMERESRARIAAHMEKRSK